MSELFAPVRVDRAICSGLPRTRQTGEIILRDRALTIEDIDAFREIRQHDNFDGDFDIVRDVAFSHSQATEPDGRFLGGERYASFYERVVRRFEALFAEPDWNDAALFAHGGTNAAVLGWASGLGLSAFGTFDQATACLNVIDVDVGPDGTIARKLVRALNITAEDPLKAERHCSDLESMAWSMKTRAASSS